MPTARPTPPVETVGVHELRENLSRYLKRVKAGETLAITKRGHEIARFAPLPQTSTETPEPALAETPPSQ
jgi:prevent-host-death family protein